MKSKVINSIKLGIAVLAMILMALLHLSCSRYSESEGELRNPSLDNPETIAYLHNTTLNRILSPQTKSGVDTVCDSTNIIPYVSSIVLEEAANIGIIETISEEEILHIKRMSEGQIAHFSLPIEDLAKYYINIFPFSDDIKDKLYELSMYDLEMGATTYLDYMNSLINVETKSNLNNMNSIVQFCAIGNASKEFWQSHETKGIKDVSAREWLATGADIAGSFLGAGIIGVIVSTVFSLNMAHGDIMPLEDAMDTNCD